MIQPQAFEALASSTNGIAKLRELILDLAVHGLLVPQDTDDEPATVQLKKIAAEKEQLFKEGKIKKQQPPPTIDTADLPFLLPVGWEWVYLSETLALVTDGDHQPPPKAECGIPFLVIGNLNKARINLNNCRYVPNEYYQALDWGRQPLKSDLLYTVTGSYGMPIAVDIDDPFCVQRHVAILKTTESSPHRYLLSLLGSHYAFDYATKIATGIAQKTVPLTGLRKMPIPLPPEQEQLRIIKKIDELMALCDQLDQHQNHSNTIHQRLLQTLLESLTQSTDNEAFQQIWAQISAHFDTLFTTESSVDQLKQVILQLAVMGKLVEQEPNDEHASVLLEKINAEKQRLTKEGKIKKQQVLPEIHEEERLFVLPSGWIWVRLGATGYSTTGKTPITANSDLYGNEIPFIGPGQITPQGKIIDPEKWLSEKGRNQTTIAKLGDILMVCIGGSIGKSAIAHKELAFNQQINCVTAVCLDNRYLHIAMNGPHFQKAIIVSATGSATPIINKSRWDELLIPLPPLAEKHRIVAKVDELMTICDLLKIRIRKSQNFQENLATSIIETNTT